MQKVLIKIPTMLVMQICLAEGKSTFIDAVLKP